MSIKKIKLSKFLRKVNYEFGQDAKEILSVELPMKGASLIALSPDSLTVAVTVLNNLYFYDAITGKLDETVENFCRGLNRFISILLPYFIISVNHSNVDDPYEISFSVDNKYLAVACDRQVKVFYNITGHRVAVSDYETKLKTAKTQAAKERFEQAIQEHKYANKVRTNYLSLNIFEI